MRRLVFQARFQQPDIETNRELPWLHSSFIILTHPQGSTDNVLMRVHPR